MIPLDWFLAFFSFLFGACVGSFLNVVAWRIPNGMSIVKPPSACPKCGHRLAATDNIPIFGWIFLRGKCRYCANPISIRYPLIELLTAILFCGTYVLMFIFQHGPCVMPMATTNAWGMSTTTPAMLDIHRDWPIYVLYCSMIGYLLAASLIDAEFFVIPLVFPYQLLGIAIVAHAIIGELKCAGHLVPDSPLVPLMTIGGAIGLAGSLLALWRGWMPRSFAEGEPMLEHERKAIEKGEQTVSMGASDVKEYSPSEVRAEIRKEMLFLIPPLLLAAIGGYLALTRPEIGQAINHTPYLSGALGAIFGGFVGAMVVWLTRILGSMGFGREAMGMGDVHLMFGVGAVIGAGASTVAFFIAPFAGLVYGIYRLVSRKGHELPYGPYLAAASVAMIFVYCPINGYLAPGFMGLGVTIKSWLASMGSNV